MKICEQLLKLLQKKPLASFFVDTVYTCFVMLIELNLSVQVDLICMPWNICRMFLCLFAGGGVQQLPQGLGSNTGSQLTVYTNVRWLVVCLL